MTSRQLPDAAPQCHEARKLQCAAEILSLKTSNISKTINVMKTVCTTVVHEG
jgi:hypothetical protein